MDLKEFSLWLIRLSLICLTIGYVGQIRNAISGLRKLRWIWSVGAALAAAHLVAAMQSYHDWSFANAYESTSQRSLALTGINAGWGIFANFLFVGFWMLDALMLYLKPSQINHSIVTCHRLLLIYLGFIAFQASIVFASGLTRWFGILAVAVLVVVQYRTSRLRRSVILS